MIKTDPKKVPFSRSSRYNDQTFYEHKKTLHAVSLRDNNLCRCFRSVHRRLRTRLVAQRRWPPRQQCPARPSRDGQPGGHICQRKKQIKGIFVFEMFIEKTFFFFKILDQTENLSLLLLFFYLYCSFVLY